MFATTMAGALDARQCRRKGCAARPHQMQVERALSVRAPVGHRGGRGGNFGLLPVGVTLCTLSSRWVCVMAESV